MLDTALLVATETALDAKASLASPALREQVCKRSGRIRKVAGALATRPTTAILVWLATAGAQATFAYSSCRPRKLHYNAMRINTTLASYARCVAI